MSSAKKKCLVITYITPRCPGGGGEVRSFHLVNAATEVFDVSILNIGGISGAGLIPIEITKRCQKVIQPSSEPLKTPSVASRGRLRSWLHFFSACIFPWLDNYEPFLTLILQYGSTARSNKNNLPNLVIRKALSFWSRLLPIPPTTCSLFNSSWKRIEDSARKLIAEDKFDIIWVENTLSWPFLERLFHSDLKNYFIICSSQNIETAVYKRLEDKSRSSPFLNYYAAQTRLMQKMELRAWAHSDLIIQCSEMDAEMTRLAVPGKMVKTIPNGVDTKYFQKKNEASLSESPTILFTAGFGYHPNIEAVEWFLDKVFLGLLSIIPNCKFLFAGSEAESVYQNIKSTRSSIDQSVECISDPPDIRPCFEKAWVYVVPLQYGGGTRLKILEAMSMRVPVVSTRIGAEGVPYEDGKHLLLADSPEDFIKAIVKLLNDPTLRTDMSANAAEFVGENYDWQRLCQQTSTVLRETCA